MKVRVVIELIQQVDEETPAMFGDGVSILDVSMLHINMLHINTHTPTPMMTTTTGAASPEK